MIPQPFDTKQEAIDHANIKCQYPKGQYLNDQNVIAHFNGKFYVVVGYDTRTVYTAKGKRLK